MRSSLKYIVGFLLFLAVIIVVVTLFLGGSKKDANPSSVAPATTLADHADTGTAIFTIDGGIVGDETHRAVRITVSKNNRKIEILKGYEGTVLNSQTYPNNATAYDVFLRSIDRAGFSSKRSGVKLTDERGVCQDGLRYVYEFQDATSPSRLWSTSCTALTGTLAGTPTAIESLFKRQIPNYSELTTGIQLLPL